MKEFSNEIPERTIGVDVGDRRSQVCMIDRGGEVILETSVATEREAVQKFFSQLAASRVVLEVGTHSPWMDREISQLGHEVVVANARKVKAISESQTKSDRFDAEMLARLGRVDVRLLSPIEHRGVQVQADRALLRARDALVRCRSQLVTSVRGQVKSFGHRLKSCSVEAFARKVSGQIPDELLAALDPLVEQIVTLSEAIKRYDRLIDRAARDRYPQTARLQQVSGVGPLTALAFVATLEDPARFTKSRDVGPFVGLVPRRHQSGGRDPRLGITKAGDQYLRRLLVQAGHYILGPFGPDCELRRFGLRIIDKEGTAPKRRAVVAVARKLAVLLHRLWVDGADYDPWYQSGRNKEAA
jgi:transposase